MKISRAELIKAIRETGREPVQRDTFYQPVMPDEVLAGGATRC